MIARYSYIIAFICLIVVLACDAPSNPEYGSGNPDPNPPDVVAPATITDVDPDSTFPGLEVTITGTGFSTDISKNLVSFGVKEAEILSASSTELIVVAPPASGNVDIKVSVLGAIDWSNAFAYKLLNYLPTIENPEVTTIDETTLWPMGIAVDDADNVYFGSADDEAIYRVTPAGDKTTFASVPIAGSIHFGSDGWLYVCERWEGKIVRISSDGSTIEDFVLVEDALDFDWDTAGNMYIIAGDGGIDGLYMLPVGGSVTEVAEGVGSVKNCRIFENYLYISKIWDGVITRFDITGGVVGEEEDYLAYDTQSAVENDDEEILPIFLDFDKNGVLYWAHAWDNNINLYAPGGAAEMTIYEEEIPYQNRWMTFHKQDIYFTNSSSGPEAEGVVFKVHIGVDQAPRF